MIEFHCPHCQKLLKTADDKAGVQAKCPGCGDVVTVPASSDPVASFDAAFAPRAEADDDYVPPDEAQDSGEDEPDADAPMKLCPMCGQSIREAATRCRYCGESLVAPVTFDAGTVLSRSWQAYQSQMGVCIGAVAIYLILYTGISFAGSLLQQLVLQAAAGEPIAVAVFMAGYQLTMLVINLYFLLGITRVMLTVARGRQADIVQLFSGFRYLIRGVFSYIVQIAAIALVAGISLTPGVVAGFATEWSVPAVVLLVVGGVAAFVLSVWLGTMFTFNFCSLIDRDCGPVEALRVSYQITSGNVLQVLLLLIAWFGLSAAGFMMCCVGTFFTMPLMFLSQSVAYVMMSDLAAANAAGAGPAE